MMTWSVAILAALLCAAPLAMAQRAVSAHVPFPFVVKDCTCPPGEWSFTRTQADPSRVMVIRNSSTGRSIALLVQLEVQDSRLEGAGLVFHRYGEKYFLRKISESGGITANLMESKEERRLQVAGLKREKTAVLARVP